MTDEFRGFNFGKEHGLPDDDVRDILQTRDGSLWILTQQGLARFDGAGFTVFDRANNPEFQSDDPRVLAEDNQGNLWVGGKNLLLRMSGNSLQRVTVAGSEKIGQAYKICADPTGLVWIGGDSTVARVTDEGVTIFGPESGLRTGGHVKALEVDQAGKLFVGTFNGLFCFDAKRQRFERADPQPYSEDRPIAALALHAARRGNLWGMFDRLQDSKSFYLQRPWVQMHREDAWVTSANRGTTNFPIGYGL